MIRTRGAEPEQIRRSVAPSGAFANVPVKVLLADMVEGAIDTTLENRPDGLNSVGRDAIADIVLAYKPKKAKAKAAKKRKKIAKKKPSN